MKTNIIKIMIENFSFLILIKALKKISLKQIVIF